MFDVITGPIVGGIDAGITQKAIAAAGQAPQPDWANADFDIANASSVDLTCPSVNAGETILAFGGNDKINPGVLPEFDDGDYKPAGFTLVHYVGAGPADANIAAFRKVSDGTEGGTTVTVPARTSRYMWAGIVVVPQAGLVVADINEDEDNDAESLTILGITTPVDNCRVIAVFGSDGANGDPVVISGTGWASRKTGVTLGGTAGTAYAIGDADMVSAGVAGDAIATPAVTNGISGFMFALRPE